MHSNTLRLVRRSLGGGLAALLLMSGCATQQPASFPVSAVPPPQILQAGDVISLSFPGAASLDTQQRIRRDGKINLSVVGEIEAAGKSPAQLEKELITLFENQLISKEVKVTMVSSSFSVFVTGAVLRPGKLLPERQITVLEAIMEAGGFDYQKANPKAVVVIRNHNGRTQNFTVNVKEILDGKSSTPFYLQSSDIIYVPERFQWF